MGVMMELGYHLGTQGNYTAVPAPSDGDPLVPWFNDYLSHEAKNMAGDGITAGLRPPPYKAQGGAGKGCDGYGAYDDYDLGSKNQQNSRETRFGSVESFLRSCATFDANGIDNYVDHVVHQRTGGINRTYKYPGFTKGDSGRFPKFPSYFLGGSEGVPRDPIAGPIEDDFGFGDQLCPVNALPKDQLAREMVRHLKWLKKICNLKGIRVDDTKGMAVQFIRRLLTSGELSQIFGVGEYYDGNPDTLGWWVWNSGMEGRCSTFDFSLRWRIQRACNNAGRYDMRQLVDWSYNCRSGATAVTFIENHDTDLSFPLIWNKALGGAILCGMEGYVCHFGRDYFQRQGCYGLRPWISNQNWVNTFLAQGGTAWRFSDFNTICFERLGGRGLLAAYNNDPYHWKTITVQTSFDPGTALDNYAAHPQGYPNSGTVYVNSDRTVTISIPPNTNGHGYVYYSRAGFHEAFKPQGRPTRQYFEGARDLSIGPAMPMADSYVMKIWCAEGTHFQLEPVGDAGGLRFWLKGPEGKVNSAIPKTGYYDVVVNSTNAEEKKFEVSATYQAPKEFELPKGWRSVPEVQEFTPHGESQEEVAAREHMHARIEHRRTLLERMAA